MGAPSKESGSYISPGSRSNPAHTTTTPLTAFTETTLSFFEPPHNSSCRQSLLKLLLVRTRQSRLVKLSFQALCTLTQLLLGQHY